MANSNIGWLIQLTKLGAGKDAEENISRIVFANVVFICLPFVYVLFILLDFQTFTSYSGFSKFDQFIVPVVIVICMLCLWLNHRQMTTISRVLFLVLWPLLLHIIPIILHEAPSDYYVALPFGIVFHSILIQLMFSYSREKALFTGFLVLNLLGIISAQSFLATFDTNHDIPLKMLNDRYFFLVSFLYWLLFNLVTFYILFIVDKAVSHLRKSKNMIEQQKEELKVLNETLAHLVSAKTSELKSKEEKLRLHAFYNSHLLRGPFCKVSGLVDLLSRAVPASRDKKEIVEMLGQSLNELDSRISEIQKVVEESE